MIPPYHGVFNNVNPVGERGDIALRVYHAMSSLTFFPTPLPFFTLQNLTSGWNSIAIRSLTDRPISRDLIRAVIFFKKKGKAIRRRGISIYFLEKLFANYYDFVIKILYRELCLFQSLFQFSRFLKILKKINVFSDGEIVYLDNIRIVFFFFD